MEIELKPRNCYFCGSKNVDVANNSEEYDNWNYWVLCDSCGARGPVGYTHEYAIRLWGIAPMTKLGSE